MQDHADLLNHAKAAVERTARSLARMRASLHSPVGAMGRQHRLLVDGALHDLGRRHEELTGMYEEMLAATADQLPACWQRFFTCYDDYLEAVRDTRSRLIQDQSDLPDQIDPMDRSRISGMSGNEK